MLNFKKISFLFLIIVLVSGCSLDKKDAFLEEQSVSSYQNEIAENKNDTNIEEQRDNRYQNDVLEDKNKIKEVSYKGWLVFYNRESDIENTNLKLNTYYLVKKDDISENFTFTQFNNNKSAIELLELVITNECNFLSPKSQYFEEVSGACLDSILSYPTGLFGDQITVSGVISDDKLFVSYLELNSFSPTESW